MLALALAATLGAAQPVVHETTVDHAGSSYQLRYRPEVTTKMRTVGMTAGSRQSSERCLWTATVQVHREISRTGEADSLDKLLPGGRTIEGTHPGHCRNARDSIATTVANKVERTEVLALAQADRSAAVADIQAAHSLALN